NRLLGRKDLLPMPMGKTVKTALREPLFLNRDTFHQPAYHTFRDDKRYEVFSAVAVWQAIDLEAPADAAKDDGNGKHAADHGIRLESSNGKPAVVSRPVDGGEVVLVTTASHSQRVYQPDGKTDVWEWSLWPDLPVFVPFMHTLINSL